MAEKTAKLNYSATTINNFLEIIDNFNTNVGKLIDTKLETSLLSGEIKSAIAEVENNIKDYFQTAEFKTLIEDIVKELIPSDSEEPEVPSEPEPEQPGPSEPSEPSESEPEPSEPESGENTDESENPEQTENSEETQPEPEPVPEPSEPESNESETTDEGQQETNEPVE